MIKNIAKKLIPSFLVSWYHFFLAFCGAILYRFPSKSLKVVGVTGTNGKSTVIELITKIFEKAGYRIASLSSIKFKIREKEWSNLLKQTMPGRFQLQKFLRKALDSGCQYAILEVTSEGIKQYRHKFINFDISVFTNLTPEHIEAHGSFEKYKEAKGKLFQSLKGRRISIVNLDDEAAGYFLNFPADEKYGYGLGTGSWQPAEEESDELVYKQVRATNYFWMLEREGITFWIEKTQFKLNLLGEFNIYNALAAICVGLSQAISLEICKSALEEIEGIPGRMELVISKPFKVFVDYAFTPAALEKVYKTIKKLGPELNNSDSKMICVLGAAGGGRDKWKRPILGKLASQHCDRIFITNEDPYDEDPMKIIEEVANGVEGAAADEDISVPLHRILDRKEAIRVALKFTEPGDKLIITGKGSEPWICVAGGKKIPWDDRKIVREEFQNLNLWKKYEILEHKADLKIKAFGSTKKELFSNALSGMEESMKPKIGKSEQKVSREIKITSLDLSALLVDFLSEVLYLNQVNKEVYSSVKFRKFSDSSSMGSGQANLEGELFGQKVKNFGEDIKAVTHHDLNIRQRTDDTWEATVLFDI